VDDSEKAPRSSVWRLLIADDHPLYRAALGQLFSSYQDLEVVGEASDGREAIELCRRLRPELILMDVRMPEVDGLEATRQIKRESPSTIVLMLTALEDPNYLLEALKAGASGYVLKEASPQQIAGAVHRVLRGESPLNQEVAMHLLERLIQEKQQMEGSANHIASAKEPSEESRQKERLLAQLTPRELEILKLLAQGQTNSQIARALQISVSTTKHHVHHILEKLGISDRMQAAVVAIEHGLLALGVIDLIQQFPLDQLV
jgi:two-component system, NarL family, response regulator LiaR